MVLFEQDREPAAIDERQSGEFIYGSTIMFCFVLGLPLETASYSLASATFLLTSAWGR